MELEPFQIPGYVAQGDKVVVEGSNRGKVRSINRAYEHDWVMVFKVSEGKIQSCYHYYDTADLETAFKKAI
jgi:ketosteroid isomerase-like protein